MTLDDLIGITLIKTLQLLNNVMLAQSILQQVPCFMCQLHVHTHTHTVKHTWHHNFCLHALILIVFTEWRIPHLYPVLHQLSTVRMKPQSVCLCVCLCLSQHLFGSTAHCAVVIPSWSHLHTSQQSHIASLCMSFNSLSFFPPWMLYRSLLSRSQCVYRQLCLRASLRPSLSPSSLHFFLLFFYSWRLDRVTAYTLTDRVLKLPP